MKNRFIRRAFLPVIFTFSTFFSLTGSVPAQTSPSSTWKSVKIVAGGFITGIIPHPTVPGLMYVRTDIGGAYRYDANLARWMPLTDVFNAADWNLLGTESIALDPVDPYRVYLAQGTYTRSEWGSSALSGFWRFIQAN